jgi:hypothetical protein
MFNAILGIHHWLITLQGHDFLFYEAQMDNRSFLKRGIVRGTI